MAYPVRHFEPATLYFITSRTIQSRFLMAPTPMTNELIGGILARAVRQCEVELFAYVFTSNHFHAIVRAPSAIAMSKFMQRLQSNIAVKVGRLVGWRGRFFARRYSAEPIVDEGAQIDRLPRMRVISPTAAVLPPGCGPSSASRFLRRQFPSIARAAAVLMRLYTAAVDARRVLSHTRGMDVKGPTPQDRTLLAMLRRMTALERLRLNDAAVRAALELREAVRRARNAP